MTNEQKQDLARLTNSLAAASAALRTTASAMQERAKDVSEAVARLNAAGVPSVARAIRSNWPDSAIRNGLAQIHAAIDGVTSIIRESRAAPYTEQRMPALPRA